MAYCECGCGGITSVYRGKQNRFKQGHYAKLFPTNDIDHSGEKYGEWTVIKKHYKKDGKQYYLCQCECGKQRSYPAHNLKRVKMCNKCRSKLNPPNKKAYGYASMIKKLDSYKYTSHRRNIEWNLTDEQAINLMKGECGYCGRKPYSMYLNTTRSNGYFLSNGIDRIDNIKGYTVDNCCSCCSQCNTAKLNMSENEFLNLIKLIYNNRIRGNNKKCGYIIAENLRMDQAELFHLVQ